ncbi:MAG: hypothetical protein KR126chlam2_00604 [Chlamydiae bacterium]|nr:hypothetical protein [Chlamydiota bacterium]
MEILSNMEKTKSPKLITLWKKLCQRLQERLPGRRVFFIYTHRNGFDRFSYGLKANTELSYWGYTALRKAFPRVTFLRLEGEKEERIQAIQPQDVVIGHIGETFKRAAQRTRRLITFNPWSGHEDRNQNKFNCLPLEEEMAFYRMAASLIFLSSEYNKMRYVDNPDNYWHTALRKLNKPVRVVHQPIDLTFFPRVKTTYTTSDFLYVGNDAHMKCLADAKKLVASLERKLTLYGTGEKRLYNLNMGQVIELPDQADFFIQPGMWEAQCVSILEAAARGFIPVVSPETGYPYDHPFLLRYGDFEYNQKVLKELLNTSPEERKALADALHSQLVDDVNHNNWKQLTDVLVEEVQCLNC